jgi:serine/threonine-protein kinase
MNKYKDCIYYPSMLKRASLSMSVAIIITISFSLITISFSTTKSEASAFFGIGSPIDLNKDLTYQNPTLGIKINYPAGWIHELHSGNLVTFLASGESGGSDTYPAGLGIKVQHLRSKNISLTQITNVQIKNLTQNHSDFKLIESTESKIGGSSPAHKIVFSATDNKKHERKAMQIWAINRDKAYLITYKAEPAKYSKYLPTIQKMIDSFQFIQ